MLSKKTSVLHLITRLIVGGAQENTLYTAELIDDKDYVMTVISGAQTGPEGSLIQNAAHRGIKLLILNSLIRELDPIKDIIAFIKITKYMMKKQFDIVHTHSSKAGILGRWAAWIAGVPTIIHTVHGWGFHDFQHPVARHFFVLAEKITLRITDKLIAVTVKDIEKGVREGIGDRDAYTLIRSGIDMQRFTTVNQSRDRIRTELGIPLKASVIGTVTRLSPQKAPQVFIDMAELVLKKLPDTFFVVVGDGPLRAQLEKQTKAKKIASQFIFTGIRHDVHDVLHAFDIFMLTSLWEGLPRVIPQAMASGVPVIASHVDGNAEIIKNNENGVLAIPGDASQFAESAIYLMNNADKAMQIRNNAITLVDEYSVHTMVEKIDRLYGNIH